MTLGELRRSLDRPDLSDDLPVFVAVGQKEAYSTADLTGVTYDSHGLVLLGDEQ